MSDHVSCVQTALRWPCGRVAIAVAMALSVAQCGGGNSADLPPDGSEAVIANDGPEGDSELIVDNARYPLNVALGDIRGISDTLFQVDYTISNGNFQFITLQGDDGPYEALVPAQATAVFFASMFSPGDQFNFGSYPYAAPDVADALSSGTGYFTDAYVGLDENNNLLIDERERFEVTSGIVEFAGMLPDIELHFSLMLSNGASVEGHYTGLFDFTER